MNLKPGSQDFLKRLMVHGTRIELALDDDDLLLFIIDDDGIKLLVVGAVRDVVLSLNRRAQIAAPQIPSEKPLPLIGEILL